VLIFEISDQIVKICHH